MIIFKIIILLFIFIILTIYIIGIILALFQHIKEQFKKTIMTPKEKAKELWLSYYELIDDIYSTEAAKDLAKNQSLIAVDEILNNDNNFFNTYSQNDYWLQVKQEIEKL
jgi:hypothetical protein